MKMMMIYFNIILKRKKSLEKRIKKKTNHKYRPKKYKDQSFIGNKKNVKPQ